MKQSAQHHFVNKVWYQKSLLTYCLLPLSWVFQFLCKCRYTFYCWQRPKRTGVPVIVVGNLTVGGTGKTPVVAALVTYFKQQGFKPGIVMRGYRGQFDCHAMPVTPQSDPFIAGEEAVMLAQKTDSPVVIGANRPLVIETLLEQDPDVNIIISDDGLQHYAMARDIEIVVVDGERGFGNGYCLPAGPLREPKKRLKRADYVVIQGGDANDDHTGQFHIKKQLADNLISVNQLDQQSALADWAGKTVHAVAGIGNPDSFFALLKAKGLHVIEHAFPDHYHFTEADLDFNDQYPILMTEKDAVKCKQFQSKALWFVPLSITLPERLEHNLLRRTQQWIKSSSRSWLAPSANNPLYTKK